MQTPCVMLVHFQTLQAERVLPHLVLGIYPLEHRGIFEHVWNDHHPAWVVQHGEAAAKDTAG